MGVNMKRIAFLVFGLVLLVANTAEARRNRWSNNRTYTQPAAAAPITSSAQPTTSQASDDETVTEASADATLADSTQVTTASHSTPEPNVRTVSQSTATAQGVANIMAARNCVGHWGGNSGYEGCGCGASPAAAYSICCYANSGMATVDVGYAQASNGMWYCCRRYR